jgi:hypothetical protein
MKVLKHQTWDNQATQVQRERHLGHHRAEVHKGEGVSSAQESVARWIWNPQMYPVKTTTEEQLRKTPAEKEGQFSIPPTFQYP